MNLIFPANKSFELSFNVGIAGTSEPPQSVSVVLEKDSKSLSFKANKVGEGWCAVISNPGQTFPDGGELNVSVNVIINNRVFSPLKTIAMLDEGPADQVVDTNEKQPEDTFVEVPASQTNEIEPIEQVEAVPENTELKSSLDSIDVVKVATKLKNLLSDLDNAQFKKVPVPQMESIRPIKSDIFSNTKIDVPKLKARAQEQVTVTSPIKVQLLKSLDTSFTVKERVKESVTIKPKSSPVKLKRTKIVFK